MRRPLPSTVLVCVFVLASASLAAAEEPRLVDRVVARIDDEAILRSDVERALALGTLEAWPGESAEELRHRVLDGLIDHRLRLREADRFGAPVVAPEAVERQVAALAERLGGLPALEARLAELGLDLAGLRYLVERQLVVLLYIDSHLAPRVFVPTDEVAAYYRDELAPEMEQRGAALPPLDEVREDIRRVLRERRLDREIAAWTAELRSEARVEIVPPPGADLPPVVDGWAAPEPSGE